ncbi:MAG: sigma-70 family RNA polymerase sigma factor [bacterium]|nr:sigma-70 family RNA polymerase sigma factor [bacterium]
MASSTHWELSWNAGVTQTGSASERDREEAAWIEAACGGDRAAFEALIKRYERRVFRLAGRFFRRPEEVEDVAQETFFTIWRKLDTYRARAPFEHWLTRVCLNCCYARFRKRRPEETQDQPLDVPITGGDPVTRLDVERLVAALEPEDRFVLQLLHGEGWTVAEISRKLGWTRSKVKVRAHRARRRLRTLLTRGSLE